VRLVSSLVLPATLLLAITAGCSTQAPPADPKPSTTQEAPPPEASSASKQAAQVKVEGAWARAVPPGSANSAVFLTLTNTGSTLAKVTGAESPAASTVELHTHVEQDGVMKMRQVESLDLPGQGHLHLQPGGDHIMLIGLTGDLAEGQQVDLELTLADGSTVDVKVPVQRQAPAGGHAHGEAHSHEHDHDGKTHSHSHDHSDAEHKHSHDDAGHAHDHDDADHAHDHDEAGHDHDHKEDGG